VRFTTLEVVDDKESGSGDWRVTLLVDGRPLDEPVTGEADEGASVALDRTAQSGGLEADHALVLTVKVEEYDGGFDSTWELIGETTETYDKATGFGLGGQVFELENDEGHVRVHCVITRRAAAATNLR